MLCMLKLFLIIVVNIYILSYVETHTYIQFMHKSILFVHVCVLKYKTPLAICLHTWAVGMSLVMYLRDL